jgi:hypothetical protein
MEAKEGKAPEVDAKRAKQKQARANKMEASA